MLSPLRFRFTIFLSVALSCLAFFTNAQAANQDANLNAQELSAIINATNPQNSLQISATPEVVAEINRLRLNEAARAQLHLALTRMQQHKTLVTTTLKNQALPDDLAALPLVESGYMTKATHNNLLAPAGLWHIAPDTAKQLGLTVTTSRDDRMNVTQATQAAVNYLQILYKRFNDWKLALLAYHYGEQPTLQLMQAVGTRDAWTLVRSPAAPSDLKNYLAAFDASVIILHDPELVAGS